jgi:hypothetical protein
MTYDRDASYSIAERPIASGIALLALGDIESALTRLTA